MPYPKIKIIHEVTAVGGHVQIAHGPSLGLETQYRSCCCVVATTKSKKRRTYLYNCFVSVRHGV